MMRHAPCGRTQIPGALLRGTILSFFTLGAVCALSTLADAQAPGGTTTPPAPPSTAAPASTTPPAAPAPPPPWYSRINVSGSIEADYDYNTNVPHINIGTAAAPDIVHTNQLQNFAFYSNSFQVPLAELVLAETPDPKASPLGFKIVLAYGSATTWIHSFNSDEGQYKNLLQAYATYVANGKTNAPITINVGKFVTWFGEEVIEAQSNYNESHGLLFAWAVPYYHAGISASRPFGSKVTLTGYLLNGWNDVIDNNNGKTGGFSVGITPNPKLTVTVNGIFGPENPGDEADWEWLNEELVSYTATPRLTLVGEYDYGHNHLPAGGASYWWQGVGGWAHYQFNDKSAAAFRAEFMDDPSGNDIGTPAHLPGDSADLATVAPGVGPQQVKEATLTYEYKFHPRVTTRLEVREDWSTVPEFAYGGGLRNNQTQFILGNIINF